MSKNGKVDLDLNEFVGERMTARIGEYEFSVSTDLRTALMFRLMHCYTILGKGAEADQDLSKDHADIAEAELWVLLDEIMQQATPAPQTPVRELFNNNQMFNFLGGLVNKYMGMKGSKASSTSRTSLAAASPSATSSEVEPSMSLPAE
jgi:hypothetical protein